MSLVGGAAGDRGHRIAGASYSNRDEIYSRDRDYWMATPGASVCSNNFATRPSTAVSACLKHPEFGAAVPGECTNATNLFYTTGSGTGTTCQYNHLMTSAKLTSLANTSVFSRGSFEINDDWLTYYSADVSRVESFSRYAPVPSSPGRAAQSAWISSAG